MPTILHKAMHHFWTRPNQFAAGIRQYALFFTTGFIQRLFLTPSRGILLARNVRIQRISSLCAERPFASISVGADSVIYENAKIEAYGRGMIEIGERSIIGDARIYSRASIRIGARLVTSWNVFIQDFDPHPVDPIERAIQVENICLQMRPSRGPAVASTKQDWKFPTDPIEIGEDVWLGANVSILKGAKIGRGCIVATGSVVTRGNWPEYSVLAGAPAKVVKSISPGPRARLEPA